MNVSAPHPLAGERVPSSVPGALLALATGLAIVGALQLPRRDPTPSTHAARVEATPPAVRPETPPPLAQTPTPVIAPTPAPPATTPAIAADSRCPPRWSVRFGHGAWTAPAGLPARFEVLRELLRQNPRANVLVLGFADPEGSDRDNHRLSLRRAASVSRALRRAGVSSDRMTVRGIGALTAMEDGTAEYAEMRRVAVRVRGIAPCANAPEEVLGP